MDLRVHGLEVVTRVGGEAVGRRAFAKLHPLRRAVAGATYGRRTPIGAPSCSGPGSEPSI